jgi:KUP system potassium uptake protein
MLITIILITMVMLIILQGDIVLVVSFFCFLHYPRRSYHSITSIQYCIGWLSSICRNCFFLIITISWTYRQSKKNEYETSNLMDKHEFIKTVIMNADFEDLMNDIAPDFVDLMNDIPPILHNYVHYFSSMN